VKKLVPTARKAAANASQLMTFDVREKASKNGWPDKVVNNTNVSFKNDKFNVSVSKKFESEALDLEYGTPRSRPTAAVRKFANNTSQIEKAIVKGMEKELGWKL